MNEKIIKSFEAWHKEKFPFESLKKLNNETYVDVVVFSRFEGYQAALAAQPQQEPVAYLYHDAASLDDLLRNRTSEILYSVCFSLRGLGGAYKNETPLYAQLVQQETPNKKYCGTCSSFRVGDTCKKCGSETFIPHPDFTEPPLPPIDKIRELAKEVGYAIGVHGTQERDFDVIAAPWVDSAVGNYGLIQHIAKGLNATIVDQEHKPLGRYAATLQIDGWYKPLDLSVCPTMQPVQQDHIADSSKLVQAVNALAVQTGESAEEITDWLTNKGGLTQLMLSHFSAKTAESKQEWIPVGKVGLSDGALIYAVTKLGNVVEAEYFWRQGGDPDRIISSEYGDDSMREYTHVMRREKILPKPPETKEGAV
jgi:hypothetical protein